MEQAYREDSGFDNSFVPRLLEQHRENLCKLFLGGLNKQVTDDDIREYFSRYGNVVDCVAIKNREDPSRGNKGFGFVTFDNLESINNVMNEFSSNGIELRGKTIDLKRAIPKEVPNPTAAHARTKKCFVGGISQNMTQDDLEEYFKAFPGVVIEKLDFKGKFAFVEFGSENDADLFSIINLHSHPKQGHRPFEVKKSEPKGDGMRDFGGGRGGSGGFGGYRGGRGRGGMPRGGGGGYQRGGGYGSGGGSYGGGYGGNSYGGGAGPGAYGGSGGYDSGFAYDNFGAPPASTAAPSGYGASAYDSASYGTSAYGSGAYGGAAQNGASGGYGDTYAQGYGTTSTAGYAAGYGSMNGGGMGSYGQEASGFGPTRGGRGGGGSGGFGRGGGGRGGRTRPY